MITKSFLFDTEFKQNMSWLKLHTKNILYMKGSYTRKPYGSIITDIDISSNVYYNDKLGEVVYNMIIRNTIKKSPFKFLFMVLGQLEKYDVPWTIDEDGSCDYNQEKVRLWLDKIEKDKILPPDKLTYIKNKLENEYIKISDLLDVEETIKPFQDITWSAIDIKNGFKVSNDKKYFLLEEIKKKIPILEFTYNYNNQYIPIDLALVDKKYKLPIKGKIKYYYSMNWYRILKSLTWKLPGKTKGRISKRFTVYSPLYSFKVPTTTYTKTKIYPEYSTLLL